ncbi:Nucleoside phosphorylase superfamily [Sesbania bispinosa]|nr:Nucleoside phosphorylase superfamily [Sesbania bispinosa]
MENGSPSVLILGHEIGEDSTTKLEWKPSHNPFLFGSFDSLNCLEEEKISLDRKLKIQEIFGDDEAFKMRDVPDLNKLTNVGSNRDQSDALAPEEVMVVSKPQPHNNKPMTEALPVVNRFQLTEDSHSPFPEGVSWVRYHGTYKDLNANLIWPGKDPGLGVDSVGTISSALVTYAAIQALQPDLIINVGTASALSLLFVYSLDHAQLVFDKMSGISLCFNGYDDFTGSCPVSECQHVVYVLDFVTKENCQKSRILLITWNGSGDPSAIFNGDAFKKVLSVFITATTLKLGQAILDVILSWKEQRSMSIHVELKYILKVVSAAAWMIVLSVTYAYTWDNPPGFAQTIQNWFGNN